MDRFRFAWKRRAGWDIEVYDARLGRFRVGQIVPTHEHGPRRSYWAWTILAARPMMPGRSGKAGTPREAARALEAAFSGIVLASTRFNMRSEDEVIFRAVLGIAHTRELDYELAVDRDEHVRPIAPSDEDGWRRWLDEERRRGNGNWIRPGDMPA